MNRKSRPLFKWTPLFPAVFFIVVYLLPLGMRVMIRPDEFRYAEIPREMLASGEWMRPRLDGVKYFEKPTLGYQLIALSMKVFGENKFAVRLPSALGTLLAAAMVWLLFRRETKENFWPSIATGIYLASALVLGEIKSLAPWKKSYDQNRQHIKKQRHYSASKGLSNQSYGFSSSHVWM